MLRHRTGEPIRDRRRRRPAGPPASNRSGAVAADGGTAQAMPLWKAWARVIRLELIPLAYYAAFAGLLSLLFSYVLFPGAF